MDESLREGANVLVVIVFYSRPDRVEQDVVREVVRDLLAQ